MAKVRSLNMNEQSIDDIEFYFCIYPWHRQAILANLKLCLLVQILDNEAHKVNGHNPLYLPEVLKKL